MNWFTFKKAFSSAAVEGLNKRLVSIELMLQGSVDELRKRFADDLVAERWEAEAREVKLQSMIEELQALSLIHISEPTRPY